MRINLRQAINLFLGFVLATHILGCISGSQNDASSAAITNSSSGDNKHCPTTSNGKNQNCPTPTPTAAPTPLNISQMSQARALHTATVMANGRVLVVGGFTPSSGAAEKAEIYDPKTGLWTQTNSPIVSGRLAAKSLLLPDGRVLIVGGNVTQTSNGHSISQTAVESYDPKDGMFHFLGNSANPRAGASITLLHDGTVLILGGSYFDYTQTRMIGLNDGEIFDPSVNSITSLTYRMSTDRAAHAATLMSSGDVMISGGNTVAGVTGTIEVYNASSKGFVSTNGLANPRFDHGAFALSDGRILFAGGTNAPQGIVEPLKQVEAYMSYGATQAFADLPDFIYAAASAQLPSSEPLFTGGAPASNSTPGNAVYLFNLSQSAFSKVGSLQQGRINHTLSILSDGGLLVVGGAIPGASQSTSSEHFYLPR